MLEGCPTNLLPPSNDQVVDHITHGYAQTALLYADRNKEERMGSVPIELV